MHCIACRSLILVFCAMFPKAFAAEAPSTDTLARGMVRTLTQKFSGVPSQSDIPSAIVGARSPSPNFDQLVRQAALQRTTGGGTPSLLSPQHCDPALPPLGRDLSGWNPTGTNPGTRITGYPNWEQSAVGGKQWTEWAAKAYDDFGKDLASGAPPKGIEDICPKFASLSPDLKRSAWIHIMSGIVALESSSNPQDGMAEGGKLAGTTSVGLCALTKTDKEVVEVFGKQPSDDELKSNVQNHIRSCMKIMNRVWGQGKNGNTDFRRSQEQGGYWSVVMEKNPDKYNQVKNIVQTTAGSFCK